MKRKIGFLVVLLFAGMISVYAQGGPPRRTVEERVKIVMEKLVDLKLDKDQIAITDTIFTDYYKMQEKAREERMAAGGQPDREKMRETMQKFIAERDDKLKKVWSEVQFKKFKDEIEATLRPQRQGSGNR